MKLIIAIILTLCLTSCNDSVSINKVIYADIVNGMTSSLEHIDYLQMNNLSGSLWEIEDPLYAKVYFLKSLYQKIDESRRTYNLIAFGVENIDANSIANEKFSDINQLTTLIKTATDELESSLVDAVEENSIVFNLEAEAKESYLNEIRNSARQLRLKYVHTASSNEPFLDRFVLESAYRHYLVTCEEIVDRLMYRSRYYIYKIYPVVVGDQRMSVSVDDTLSLDIGVGSYMSHIDTTLSGIIITGDTVRFNRKGLARFNKKISSYKDSTVEIECFLEHPISGDQFTGSTVYKYQVR